MAPDMTEVIDDADRWREEPSPATHVDSTVEPPRPHASSTAIVGSRIVRRPRELARWPVDQRRIARYLTALIVVGGTTFSVLKVVHLNLVFETNTPTGGDMGAHVMAPGLPARPPAAALPAQRLEQRTGTPASRCTASTWSCRR